MTDRSSLEAVCPGKTKAFFDEAAALGEYDPRVSAQKTSLAEDGRAVLARTLIWRLKNGDWNDRCYQDYETQEVELDDQTNRLTDVTSSKPSSPTCEAKQPAVEADADISPVAHGDGYRWSLVASKVESTREPPAEKLLKATSREEMKTKWLKHTPFTTPN